MKRKEERTVAAAERKAVRAEKQETKSQLSVLKERFVNAIKDFCRAITGADKKQAMKQEEQQDKTDMPGHQ